MNERNVGGLGVVVGALCAVGLVSVTACGGGAKGANSPGNCPEGTVLNGSDCAASAETSSPSSDPSSSSTDAPSGGASAATTDSSPRGSSSPSGSSGSGPPYQKDAVEIELKRASRQIKANCGSATDDNGTASGPWGKTSASVTLGRNGHIKEVTVPAPYDAQPEGACAVNAFKKIQFPPYASETDVVLPWDIEFVKPKR